MGRRNTLHGFIAREAAVCSKMKPKKITLRPVTDAEIKAWGERHNLGSMCDEPSLTDLRACYEDAISLHMLPTPHTGKSE